MLNLNFSEFPKLTTERVLLRDICAQDLERIHQLRCDQAVNIMVGRETPTNLSQTMEFITKIENMIEKKECLYWGMTFKEENSLIGTISCWNFDVQNEIVEIGYEMLPEFRGKGLMKEALNKVIEFAFEGLNATLITAFPSVVNENSVAILKTLNFQLKDKSYNNKHTNVDDVVTYVLKRRV